jgi:hypothetical protein
MKTYHPANRIKRSSLEFVDTKRVKIILKLMKDKQHNGQKKHDKKTNNDPQKTTQKTNDTHIVFKCTY